MMCHVSSDSLLSYPCFSCNSHATPSRSLLCRRRFVEGQSVVAFVSQVKKVEMVVKGEGGGGVHDLPASSASAASTTRHLTSLSLKPSLTLHSSSTYPAQHLECLFNDLELADKLSVQSNLPSISTGALAASSLAIDWSSLAIGCKVDGFVHEAVEYGLLIDLPTHPDLVGLVLPHQQVRATHSFDEF